MNPDTELKNDIIKLVSNVDYSTDPDYLPSDFALEFINFIKLVNGPEGEENTSPVLHYKMLDTLASDAKNIINMLFRGAAKALSLDTPLLTPFGVVPMRDIKSGDPLIDREGNITHVTHVSEIFYNPTYTLVLEDGTEFIANEDHLHIINTIEHGKVVEKNYSTLQLLNLESEIYIPLISNPVQNLEIPLDACYRALGASFNKSSTIPQYILFDSSQRRLELFKGLLQSVLYTSLENTPVFTCFKAIMADNIKYLVKSLGGYAKITKICRGYMIQVHMPSKFNLHLSYTRDLSKGIKIISITKNKTTIPTKCVAVDSPTHSYLLGDCTITHNTTVFAEYLFLYIAVYSVLPNFGSVDLAIYVSDSIENGVKNLRKNLEYRWENSSFLQKYVPNIKFTDIRWEFINAKGIRFIVKGYGSTTGVRGTKEMGKRPVLCVLDDLVSDSDAKSPTVIANIEDTVYKAVDYAMHPTRFKIIWSGTPFNARDPLYKAVESTAWACSVFPVCEKFPCSKEDFKSAWPDRFTYEAVKAKYDKALLAGKIDTFNQEMMLRIMSDEERLIQDSDIIWYHRNAILEHKQRYNFYITTDFATSEATSSDFSVIFVWALNNKGFWYFVDGICKKQLMDKNINDLFRLCQEYSPQAVGIEVSGQQGGFIPWVQQEMLDRNIYFNLASEANSNKPGIRPNTNKFTRFNTIVPWFKAHRMFFPVELKEDPLLVEYMDELTLVSIKGFRSKNDDCLDGTSQLAFLTTWRPSEEDIIQPSKGNLNIWDDPIEEVSGDLESYII